MSEIAARCAPFEEDLSALIDGELDADRASEVEAHVAACSACARRLVVLRTLDATLADVAASPIAGEAERLARVRATTLAGVRGTERAALPGRRAPPRRRRWLIPAATGAAAAAAAALFALWRPEPTPNPVIATEPAVVAEAKPRAQPDAAAFAGRGASALADDAPAEAPPTAARADAIDDASDEELELASALERLELESANDLELVEQLDVLESLHALDDAPPGRG